MHLAAALTFSSYIIIFKLLSDKREIDSLHGRIAAGFLTVQDIAVVLAMMVMSTLRPGDEVNFSDVATSMTLRVALCAGSLYVLMRHVLPPLVAVMARSRKVLLVFAVGGGMVLTAIGESARSASRATSPAWRAGRPTDRRCVISAWRRCSIP